MAQLEALRNIPPHNPAATSPADAYRYAASRSFALDSGASSSRWCERCRVVERLA